MFILLCVPLVWQPCSGAWWVGSGVPVCVCVCVYYLSLFLYLAAGVQREFVTRCIPRYSGPYMLVVRLATCLATRLFVCLQANFCVKILSLVT